MLPGRDSEAGGGAEFRRKYLLFLAPAPLTTIHHAPTLHNPSALEVTKMKPASVTRILLGPEPWSSTPTQLSECVVSNETAQSVPCILESRLMTSRGSVSAGLAAGKGVIIKVWN